MDTTYKVAISRYQLKAKLPPGDPLWKEFNASFDNRAVTPEHLIDEIYKGKAITTWHKDNWRTSENYMLGQHIGLDFDSGDEKSTIAYWAKNAYVKKYASFMYTTVSHTPDNPRARLIFLLDAPIFQAKNYALAVSALLWIFETADRQCKDPVRFFYGSAGCEVEWFGNVLPLQAVHDSIRVYRESGQAERHQAAKREYSAPPSQQEVADALKFIPPWGVAYDEWVQVLMGIHSAFGDAGRGLADSWADGKPGEVEQKWRSFHTGKQDAVTVATVFGLAKRFGWRKAGAQ